MESKKLNSYFKNSIIIRQEEEVDLDYTDTIEHIKEEVAVKIAIARGNKEDCLVQDAAQQLLHNGILVETNKGLKCMSLKDAVNEGVGGVSLSEEDLQNVATKLLAFQDVPAKATNYTTPLVKPIKAVPQRRSLSRTVDIKATGPSSSLPLFDAKNFIVENDDLDSVLVSDSGLSSDTSEVVSVSNTSSDSFPPKKRGGWPKGRKRKPDNKGEVRPPKAPATGYVLFLNEKRKDYKFANLRFTEVTKILGNIWSSLSMHEKRKYLDQAEIEKKRYREELKAFRQSDTYRQYLQRKKFKRILADGTEESDMDATDEIDDDEGEELYCRPCNQYFHSLHNKKEHMYGRQHLVGIASNAREECPATSLDESSLDGARDDSAISSIVAKDRVSIFANMDETIVRFMSSVLQREREIVELKSKVHFEATARNQSLIKTLAIQEKKVETAMRHKQEEIQEAEVIKKQLLNLLRVPTLFGEYSPV